MLYAICVCPIAIMYASVSFIAKGHVCVCVCVCVCECVNGAAERGRGNEAENGTAERGAGTGAAERETDKGPL